MDGTATYLYCIVNASKAPSIVRAPHGLPGATRPTATALAPSFWLVIASVPLEQYGPEALEPSLKNAQWITDVALAHERVVEHFARQAGATVIPMKLFTMFSSAKLALAATRSRISILKGVVGRIAGCEEWGVRITIPPSAAGGAPARAANAVSGTEFLATKKAARDRARQSASAAAEAAEHAFSTLSAIARDARRRRDAPEGSTAPPLLDAAFLVPADRRLRFKTAVRALADGSDATLVTLTGPWPSYNFIDAEPNV
jgi:hypothetical protein